MRVISYVFTGKLTLFPVVIIFLGFGAGTVVIAVLPRTMRPFELCTCVRSQKLGYLLFYGNKTYSAGYFESTELYYGVAGLVVSVVALTLFFFLVTWMVLRISFVVTPSTFRVLKSGILRSILSFTYF